MTAPQPMHRNCHHCSAPFDTFRREAWFCSRKCKTDSANLEAARGKQLYRLAYGWRKNNKGSFSDLSALVDLFIREDKEGLRPPPPAYKPVDMTPTQSYMTKRAPKVARQRAAGHERNAA